MHNYILLLAQVILELTKDLDFLVISRLMSGADIKERKVPVV
jgi:hypothetical protein